MSESISDDLAEEIGDAIGDADDPAEIPVNVYTTDDTLVIVGACPGVHADDVQASIHDGTLEVSVRLRSAAPKDYLRREWAYGAMQRTLDLPREAGLPATASIGNGQLAISLTLGSTETGDIEIT